MATVTDLAESLAGWLGLPREIVDGHVRRLREAALLPVSKGGRGKVGGAPVSTRHAADLLLALMTESPAVHAPAAVRLFRGLPLLAIHRTTIDADHGTLQHDLLREDDPAHDVFPPLFGDALECIIQTWRTIDMGPDGIQICSIQIGGGAGTHRATLQIFPAPTYAGPPFYSAIAHFGVTRDGRLPDDVALCRLDRFSQVPGHVLYRLNRLLAGRSGDVRPVRHQELVMGAP